MWKRALFIYLVTLPAWAFNLTQDFVQGFYWATLPITFQIEEADESRRITLEQLTEDAIGEWETRTGLSLWDIDEGSTNIIRWSSNFAEETKMDPMTVLAVAIRYTHGPYFAKTEIVINGNHPLNHELNHLLTTITHELGHTMGLDHSDHPEAVMAPTLQDPYRGLHTDDVDGMVHTRDETENRQEVKFVSPLAYEKVESKQPVSCGTVGVTSGGASGGPISLGVGMLIAFVRKLWRKFKSLF